MPDVVLECLRPQSLPLVSTSSNKAAGYCHKAAPCCEPIGTHFIQTTTVCSAHLCPFHWPPLPECPSVRFVFKPVLTSGQYRILAPLTYFLTMSCNQLFLQRT